MHKHHIIPLHEWRERIDPTAERGDKEFNSPDNIIYLTVEQHADVHRWLWESFHRQQDLIAWAALSRRKVDSKVIFTKDHRIKLSEAAKRRVYSEQERQNYSKNRKGKVNFCEDWEITYPNGNVEIITNLRKFCRDMGLTQSAMSRISSGSLGRHTHKGYRCKRISPRKGTV